MKEARGNQAKRQSRKHQSDGTQVSTLVRKRYEQLRAEWRACYEFKIEKNGVKTKNFNKQLHIPKGISTKFMHQKQ